MHRLFVALRPPAPIRDMLLDAMDDGADFRWQQDTQLHLTLRFVGEVDRHVATDLADALARVRAPCLTMRIKGLGSFDHRNSGTIWAGVEPAEPVTALAAKIERVCQAVGLEPERRTFHPHITLARWTGRRTRELAEFLDRGRAITTDAFGVTQFILFESHLSRHGPHYEAVAHYPLG